MSPYCRKKIVNPVACSLVWVSCFVLILIPCQLPAAILSPSHRLILESLGRKSTNELALIAAGEIQNGFKNVEGLSNEDRLRYLNSSNVSFTINQFWSDILTRIRLEPPLPVLSDHGSIPASQMKQLRRLLRINAKVLRDLHTGTNQADQPIFDRAPPSAWGNVAMIQAISYFKSLSTLLTFDAAVLCQDGDSGLAFESFKALISFARSSCLEDSPWACSEAILGIRSARSALRRFVEAKLFTPEQLALVLKEIESFQIHGHARRSFFGLFCESVHGRNLILAARGTGSPGLKTDSVWSKHGADLLVPEMAWAYYVIGMAAFFDATRAPQDKLESIRVNLLRELKLHTQNQSSLADVTTLMDGEIVSSYDRLWILGEELEIMKLFVHVEQYRLGNSGRLPPSIDALIPTYMGAIPLNPINRQPIHYQTIPGGYLIYSLGFNGIDDTAGTITSPEADPGDDLVLKVVIPP